MNMIRPPKAEMAEMTMKGVEGMEAMWNRMAAPEGKPAA